MKYILLSLLVILMGCCGLSKTMPKIKNVDIELKNVGKTPLTWSEVKIGEYTSTAGNLRPGVSATHLFFNHPVTDYSIVKYMTKDSAMIVKKVAVLKQFPSDFKGNVSLLFAINPDSGDIDVGIFQWRKVNGEDDLVRLNPEPSETKE